MFLLMSGFYSQKKNSLVHALFFIIGKLVDAPILHHLVRVPNWCPTIAFLMPYLASSLETL
jgi:hypothetical protein